MPGRGARRRPGEGPSGAGRDRAQPACARGLCRPAAAHPPRHPPVANAIWARLAGLITGSAWI